MCMAPMVTKNSDKKPVACGRCPECRARRVSGWSFRLMEEEKHSSSSYFLTLTYSNENVPLSSQSRPSTCLVDLQKFFKRLRKVHGAVRLKYFAVSEYGSQTNRPHYHVILFNADVKRIQAAWGLGEIHYGTVTGASVGYCLKYISKPQRIPAYRGDTRQRPFAVMSKGLGRHYLTKSMLGWHKADLENRMYLNLKDGKKISMPRYYKDSIYNESERKAIAEKALRKHIDRVEKLESSSLQSNTDYRNAKTNVKRAIENQFFVKDKKGKL